MIKVVGAVQFLTRVPVRTSRAAAPGEVVPWFPFVGALIGAAVGGIAAGMMEVSAPLVAGAVAVLAGVLITGAFHEDGLADTMDAIAGGTTPERRHEILKDPRHGSYGVAALCGSIVLRVACVASLGPAAAFAGLVSAHALGRASAVGVMALVPPARPDGLGAASAQGIRTAPAIAGIGSALVITGAATGVWVLALAATAVIAAAIVVPATRRAFGGMNGDILGAVEQVTEATVLIAITVLADRSNIWWA